MQLELISTTIDKVDGYPMLEILVPVDVVVAHAVGWA